MSARNTLGKLLIKLHRRTPDFRGKQAASRAIEKRLLGTTVQKSLDGVLLETRLSSSTDLSFLEEGGHTLIRREISKLKLGDTFLDIGANAGYFSILASKKIGNTGIVISIEPSQREYKILLSNIQHNSCTNIFPLNCAASNQAEMIQLEAEPDNTGLNKTHKRRQNSSTHGVIALPIADIAPDLQINLAKIDTEGFELFALKGMRKLFEKNKVRKIIVEISPKFLEAHNQEWTEIYEYLSKYGFSPDPNTDTSTKQWDEIFTISDEQQ